MGNEIKAKRKIFTALAVLTVMVACANSPQKTNSRTAAVTAGRSVTNQAAKEVKAHDFVEITFEPGSSTLTESSRTAINDLLAQAGRSGKIDEVMVLSWADEEYPSEASKKLSKSQRDLAARRNTAVEKQVKANDDDLDVDSYNMAKRPNVVSKWLNTNDAKLKKSLVAAGLPTNTDDPQYPSKASHAVVLVKVE